MRVHVESRFPAEYRQGPGPSGLAQPPRLGYYRGMRQDPDPDGRRRIATSLRLKAAPAVMAAALACSCGGLDGSLAVVDPVLAYLSPGAAEAFGSYAEAVVVLPDEDASAALYAAIDSRSPETLFLSPLLVAEIPYILARGGETRVACVAAEAPASDPRVCAAVFSPVGAASVAGAVAAGEAIRLAGNAAPPIVAAVLSSGDEARAAFVAAYAAAGGPGEPVVELADGGFSQAAADRLAAMDVRIAYVSVPPDQAARWLEAALDEYAFRIVAEAVPADGPIVAGVGPARPYDVTIAWDFEATLADLTELLRSGGSGAVPGSWKAEPSRLGRANMPAGDGR